MNQEPRHNVQEVIFQQALAKECVSFQTSLEVKQEFFAEFLKTHTEEEIETLRTKTEFIGGAIINTVFFEREETDIEYADRIKLKQLEDENRKQLAISSFKAFIAMYPKEAAKLVQARIVYGQAGD